MKKYSVWYNGELINIEIGQKVFVGYCASGRNVSGENAQLERATKKNLVFKTESGAVVKTAIDNLHKVCGELGKKGFFVSPVLREDFIKTSIL